MISRPQFDRAVQHLQSIGLNNKAHDAHAVANGVCDLILQKFSSTSPEACVPVVYSCRELLTFDKDRLAQFLNDCRTPHDEFDISRVAGVDGLSEGQQGEFGDKLR